MIALTLTRCTKSGMRKEMMRSVHTFLSRFDAFSQKPEFRVLEQQSFSTMLGQFMTVILMTLCLFSFGTSLQSTLNHNSPSIMQSQEFITDTPAYPLMKDNFTFALNLLDANQNHLVNMSQYLSMAVQNCFVSRSTLANQTVANSRTCNTYQMQQCDLQTSFKSDAQINLFQARNLSNYFCINSTQWDQQPITLQGTSSSNTFQYLVITTLPCRNSTANKNSCQSQEKINTYIQGIYYLFFIDGVLSQVSNYTDPFQQYIKTESTQLSMSSSKQIYQFLNINEVLTDTGLIFKETDQSSAIALSEVKMDSNPYNGQYLAMHLITITGVKQTYSRSYQKLQTILGQLGGLWQVSLIIFGMLINPITRKLLYLNMANGLYDLNGLERTNTDFLKNSQDIQNQDQEKKVIRDFVKKRVKSIKINTRIACSFIFGLQSSQKIQNAHLNIMSQLDLQYILNKLIEVDQLKEIILTEEQNYLFRFLQKPYVIQKKKQPEVQMIEQAHQAFLRMQRKDIDKHVYQNLMLNLDPGLLGLFQHFDNKSVQLISQPNSERMSIQDQGDEVIELESRAQVPKRK